MKKIQYYNFQNELQLPIEFIRFWRVYGDIYYTL